MKLIRVLALSIFGTLFDASFAPIALAQSAIPAWAAARWEALAKSRWLLLSSHMKFNTLPGDFDGDGKPDIALLVEHRTTHKIGIVFIHNDRALPRVVGAGTNFGNGGDNFDWMDSWKVQPRTRARPTDAIVIERESSASALIYFAGGKYRWKQLGD